MLPDTSIVFRVMSNDENVDTARFIQTKLHDTFLGFGFVLTNVFKSNTSVALVETVVAVSARKKTFRVPVTTVAA